MIHRFLVQNFSGQPITPYMLAPGAILAGKYRIERVIGEGGMGVVVAATHIALDQRVALKILRVQSAADRPEVVERFLREARSAVRLRSQHVAKVFDVGTLEGGTPFIVLEYLEGADLDSVRRIQGPLAHDRAIALVLQACEAVAEAHALGIVHRDLKPHNLFLTTNVGGDDLLKVLDFGIAKSGTMAGGALTRSDSSVGSPLYMSPEQMRSPRDVDHRTDIWSLGVTLYEIIAGQPPFDAESFPELVLKVQEGRFVPLSEVRPDVPAGLSRAIGQCLQSDLTLRYASVAELATALEPFTWPDARIAAQNARRALGMSPSAPGLVVASSANDAVATQPSAASSGARAWSGVSSMSTSRPLDTRPRRRAIMIAFTSAAVIIAAVLAFTIVGFVWMSSGPKVDVAASAPPARAPAPSVVDAAEPAPSVPVAPVTAVAASASASSRALPARVPPRASSSVRAPPSRPVPVDDVPAER